MQGLSSFHSQGLSISKQGLLSHGQQMLPTANIGSHIFFNNLPSPPSILVLFLLCSLLPVMSHFSRCTILLQPFSLPFTVHPYHAPPQMSDLASLSAAGVHWLPSSGMSSTVHHQHEVGYFKAYLPSVLMSKKSRAVLLMAFIWLQPPRLLGVCLYIA